MFAFPDKAAFVETRNTAKRYATKAVLYIKENRGMCCIISPREAIRIQRTSITNPAITMGINILFSL